jgi:hypothetical protein
MCGGGSAMCAGGNNSAGGAIASRPVGQLGGGAGDVSGCRRPSEQRPAGVRCGRPLSAGAHSTHLGRSPHTSAAEAAHHGSLLQRTAAAYLRTELQYSRCVLDGAAWSAGPQARPAAADSAAVSRAHCALLRHAYACDSGGRAARGPVPGPCSTGYWRARPRKQR